MRDGKLERSILVQVCDCCTIEIHNVVKGNTSPFQENNEIQGLICFLNAIYNVIVPFQVTGYRNTYNSIFAQSVTGSSFPSTLRGKSYERSS